MKPKILFASEEAQVLSDLRSFLHARRDGWELFWSESAAHAADYLIEHQIDVVVSDMRMRGPDGHLLLDYVRTSCPGTARIVLVSGAKQEPLFAVAGAAQQFLPKSCDPDTLIALLEAMLVTRSLIADANLREILGGVENLPKPPAIYSELCALADSPTACAADIAKVLERDVATTTELLKLVNSALFGVVSEVTSVRRAVTLLGLDVIQSLVLAGRVFRASGALPPGLDPAAVAARGIAACKEVRRVGAALGWDGTASSLVSLAALLHDVGLLALAANEPESWCTYQDLRDRVPAREAELEAFGCTIGQASAYILGLWGFPPPAVAVLAAQPVEVADGGAGARTSAAQVVAKAHRDLAMGTRADVSA